MKNNIFNYLFLLNAIAALAWPISPLNAAQNYTKETNVDQSQIVSTHVPQALKNFVEQAMQQGLSVDLIIEQALKQGYTREQVVAAYSVVMVQDDDTTSINDTLIWYTLGAVVVGICGWLTYKWLTSETIERTDEQNGQLNLDHFQMLPVGRDLSEAEVQQFNQIVEQGFARGLNPDNILLEVRQAFPDTAFHGGLPRPGARFVLFQEEPWNKR